MRVSPSYAGAVHRQEEAARRPSLFRRVWRWTGIRGEIRSIPNTERDASLAQRKPLCLRGGDVVEDGRVKDDEGSVLWSFVAKPHEVAPAQVALQHPWPDRGSDLYGRPQIGEPRRLLRPDQRLEPCDLRGIRSVDRAQVQSCPPDDLRRDRRQRRRLASALSSLSRALPVSAVGPERAGPVHRPRK
jgi:hypothetical protein